MKKFGLIALAGVCALNVRAENLSDKVVEQNCFDAIYGGLGIGGSFRNMDADAQHSDVPLFIWRDSKNFNRFMGSIVLGCGKAFEGKYYLGLEALVDLSNSKKKDYFLNSIKCESKGFNPQLGIRLGYVFNNDNLFYFKAGMGYSKIKAILVETNENSNIIKYSPFIGLGLEKAFYNNFSARLEAEYHFGKNKSYQWYNLNTGEWARIKAKKINKGFVVRALINYNIKY